MPDISSQEMSSFGFERGQENGSIFRRQMNVSRQFYYCGIVQIEFARKLSQCFLLRFFREVSMSLFECVMRRAELNIF